MPRMAQSGITKDTNPTPITLISVVEGNSENDPKSTLANQRPGSRVESIIVRNENEEKKDKEMKEETKEEAIPDEEMKEEKKETEEMNEEEKKEVEREMTELY